MAGPIAAAETPLMAFATAVTQKFGNMRIAVEAATMVTAATIMRTRFARVASTKAPSGVVATMPA